jgi:hypothetical protein
MLVAAWGIAGVRGQEPGSQSPVASEAQTGAATDTTGPPAEAQARAIDTLLADSEASRAALAPALQKLEDCRDLGSAMAVVETVRDERDQQRGIARSLATDRLPGGAALKESLIDVFDRSYQADENYLRWGRALQSRGCSGSHTSVRRWDSERTLAQRTEAKKNLIRQWNGIADSFGHDRRESTSI